MIASLLVLALTFSTDFDGALMRLPAWMRTMTVSAEDTFGTAEHTNSSRRVARSNVAAVIAAPAAFYERAYYASEGASNVWDTSEYGPLAPSADSFSTNFSAGPFYVPHGTNDPPLTVVDTLRLVEHENIVRAFEDGMSSLIDKREDGRLPLARPSWDSDIRRVFWSHTKMPDSADPETVGWSSTDRFVDAGVRRWFVPLAACAFGFDALHEFEFDPSSGDGRDSVVRQLFRDATFGSAESEIDLDAMIPEPGYGWYTNGVRDVISRSLGVGVGSRYMSRGEGDTLRLAPDDYTHVSTSVRREYIDSFSVTIYDEPWEPWNELSKEYLHENFRGHDEAYADYARAEFAVPFARGKIRAGYPSGNYETVVSRVFDFALPDVPEGADVLVFEGASPASFLDVQSSNGWESAEGTYVASAGWMGGEPNELTFDAYKTTLVTNFVDRRATDIAGACRAAAVMDRTFEIAQKRDGVYYGERDLDVHGVGRLTNRTVVVSAPGTIHRDGARWWIDLAIPAGSYDLPRYKASDMSVSATTNASSAPAFRDVAYFGGSYLQLDHFDVLACPAYRVNFHTEVAVSNVVSLDEARMIPEGGSFPARILTSWDDLTLCVRLNIDVGTNMIYTTPFPALDCSPVESHLGEFLASVKLRAEVYGSYYSRLTDALDAKTAKMLYAFAGPSPGAFSSGRVPTGGAASHTVGGVVCEFVKPGYDVSGEYSWPDVQYNPEERAYSPTDVLGQERQYRMFERAPFSSSLGWIDGVVDARAATRAKCLAEVMRLSGANIERPDSVMQIEDDMLQGGSVSVGTMTIPCPVPVSVVPDKGYVKRRGDAIELRLTPGDSETPVEKLFLNAWFGGLGEPTDVEGYEPASPHSVKNSCMKPPASANGKASTVITTDWKWKALGVDD